MHWWVTNAKSPLSITKLVPSISLKAYVSPSLNYFSLFCNLMHGLLPTISFKVIIGKFPIYYLCIFFLLETYIKFFFILITLEITSTLLMFEKYYCNTHLYSTRVINHYKFEKQIHVLSTLGIHDNSHCKYNNFFNYYNISHV